MRSQTRYDPPLTFGRSRARVRSIGDWDGGWSLGCPVSFGYLPPCKKSFWMAGNTEISTCLFSEAEEQETNKTKYPGLQIAGRRTDLGLEQSSSIRKRIHIQQRTQRGIIDSWCPLRCHTKVSPSHCAFLVIGIDCFMRKAMISRATDLDGMDTTVTNPGSVT